MAIRPCSRCHRRFLGPAYTLYYGLLHLGNRLGAKEWLCTACSPRWNELAGLELGSSAPAYGDVWQLSLVCDCCTEPVTFHSAALFVSHYAPKEEREDTYHQLCEQCHEKVRSFLRQLP